MTMHSQSKTPGTTARKGDKRERTRARLIEVAAQVIGEKGYERMALDEVAARAGMTRGAIYGNFADREELLLAVVKSGWKPVIPSARGGASLRERMRILGQAVVDAAPARQAHAIGAASFQLYALTHPQLRRKLSRWNSAIYRRAAAELRRSVPENQLPIPAREFVRVVHALTDGLLLLRFLTPELITDEVIRSGFMALAGERREP